MRKSIKFLALSIVSVFSALILFAGFYEVYEFRPCLSRMNSIYQGMAPEDKEPPQNVRDFIGKVEGKRVDTFVATRLLGEIKHPQRMASWHYHELMWELLLPLHFTKTQRTAFYCHYLSYEHGLGFSEASQFYFEKQPDELSLEEVAAIVAIGTSPVINSPSRHPDRLEAAKKQLLSDYASIP
jgi:transglycosylase-like protein